MSTEENETQASKNPPARPPSATPPDAPSPGGGGAADPAGESPQPQARFMTEHPLRIALLSWETLHSVRVGGVAVHVTELAAALERRGHDVHVFTRVGQGQPTFEEVHGGKYHRCPMDLNPDFVTEMNNLGNSMAYFMAANENEVGKPFDIVHGHDWLAAKGMVQMKNDHGRRAIFTIHSTEYGRCGNHFRPGNSERVRHIEREGTYVADRVITVSGYCADEAKFCYEIPNDKIRVIYNGINCEPFDGYIDPAVCRRTYGVGPLDPMVLFVGRMSTQKGPDLLLEAIPGILHQRPDAKVVFVGDGDMRGWMEHRARELGISHAVRFPGAMTLDGDLINLYKSTDVVCTPSRNEPFGIVILEAWAAGKPVIVTPNGGPREFVSHDQDGYFVDLSPASVCWGVNNVFKNFEHARWMGERGRVKAAFGFSWDKIADQTEGVYREVL